MLGTVNAANLLFSRKTTAVYVPKSFGKVGLLLAYACASFFKDLKKKVAIVDDCFVKSAYEVLNLPTPTFTTLEAFLDSPQTFDVAVVELAPGAFFTRELIKQLSAKTEKLVLLSYDEDVLFQDVDQAFSAYVTKDATAVTFTLRDAYDFFDEKQHFVVHVNKHQGVSVKVVSPDSQKLDFQKDFQKVGVQSQGRKEDVGVEESLFQWIRKKEEESGTSPFLASVVSYACVKFGLTEEQFNDVLLPKLNVEAHPERKDVFFATTKGNACKFPKAKVKSRARGSLRPSEACVKFVEQYEKVNGVSPTLDCVATYLSFYFDLAFEEAKNVILTHDLLSVYKNACDLSLVSRLEGA